MEPQLAFVNRKLPKIASFSVQCALLFFDSRIVSHFQSCPCIVNGQT
jgi:hypothetical protein